MAEEAPGRGVSLPEVLIERRRPEWVAFAAILIPVVPLVTPAVFELAGPLSKTISIVPLDHDLAPCCGVFSMPVLWIALGLATGRHVARVSVGDAGVLAVKPSWNLLGNLNWSGRARHLRWDDIAGYRDGDADAVQVVAKPALHERPIDVPTPTEALRVAVLRALDARGIRRLEGASS